MTITTGQLWAIIIAIFGLILTILNIIDKVSSLKKNANAPIIELQKSVAELNVTVKEMKKSLDSSHDKHREQKELNVVFIHCMLAFIDFEVAYCAQTNYKDNAGDLENARRTLQEYLTNR